MNLEFDLQMIEEEEHEMIKEIATECFNIIAKHYSDKITAVNPEATEIEVMNAVQDNWTTISKEIETLYTETVKLLTQVENVKIAMLQVRDSRISGSRCWYLVPSINDIINEGVKLGWLNRCSQTQVEWSDNGFLECYPKHEYSKSLAK